MTTTASGTERLVRDVMPAEVHAPGHSPHVQLEARVFVTDRRVQVWVRGPDGPVALVDEELTAEAPERNRGTLGREQLHLETAAGPVHVSRGRGCGCGSGLRAVDRPAEW